MQFPSPFVQCHSCTAVSWKQDLSWELSLSELSSRDRIYAAWKGWKVCTGSPSSRDRTPHLWGAEQCKAQRGAGEGRTLRCSHAACHSHQDQTPSGVQAVPSSADTGSSQEKGTWLGVPTQGHLEMGTGVPTHLTRLWHSSLSGNLLFRGWDGRICCSSKAAFSISILIIFICS